MCLLPLQCVVLLAFMSINHVHAKCDGVKECDRTAWLSWSNCSVTRGVRFRQKALCCSVKSPTFENCLKHCNLTEPWWWANSYEQDTCETSCIQRLDKYTYYQCKCSPDHSSYSCERGETFFKLIFMSYDVPVYNIDG